ncbi:putative quinol monooxygenase [Phyllobacterium leguminum]|uniref:Quinol monooxygenase YgiN n=1 Tax=Phyllobacterium leguminum TaxID=314237 RepID=A0A318T1D3_9HYPH|nr:putative quinol monooxygenase [Phyllobacterium leguminum]PYE87548.1 quinol monooxygenase YgiN [Phyllobacterium leguminum]
MSVVTVIAQLTAQPGREAELGKRLRGMIEPTLKEKGCINYDLHRSAANPATWMFYENWQSQDDLDAHTASKHFEEFQKTKHEVLAQEMTVHIFAPDAETTRIK